MDTSPRDKMVKSKDEITKTRKRVRRYFFPHLGVTIAAESQEEAEKIAASRPTK